MNININYQKELDKEIEKLSKKQEVPTLLLHSCCAPCSSYVLEYLSEYFEITIYYYNPNIYPELEYYRRLEEQEVLLTELNQKETIKHKIKLLEGVFNPNQFYTTIKGHEKDREGGERCFKCYELRLREAVVVAKDNKYDYFTTTLTISPHKNAQKINEIAEALELEYGVKHLTSDFKKKNGYKRSIELSKEYDLYRQDYCGCVYSVPVG